MFLTTTSNIEGKIIEAYVSIVTGEIILSKDVIKELAAQTVDEEGKPISNYEHSLQSARFSSQKEMTQRALEHGADAIVGVHFSYENLGNGALMISCTGTAVKLKK